LCYDQFKVKKFEFGVIRMANALYPLTREKFLQATMPAWDSGDYRILLIRTAGGTGPYYTYSAAHDFLDDVPNNSACRPATAVALTESSPANDGTADAADVTFPTVASGEAIQALIVYRHTGTESTSELVAYWDVGVGLPVTPNGADVNCVFNASGLFKL